jgi:membrane protein DedA with SNARE-associated domain
MLGITIWNTLLIGLGYSLRENYGKVAGYYSRYKHNLIPVLIIAVAFIIIHRIYNKKKKESARLPE